MVTPSAALIEDMFGVDVAVVALGSGFDGLAGRVVVPEQTVVFTVKLPVALVDRVRERTGESGGRWWSFPRWCGAPCPHPGHSTTRSGQRPNHGLTSYPRLSRRIAQDRVHHEPDRIDQLPAAENLQTRGHFPDRDSAMKLIYLGLRNISSETGGYSGTGTRNWTLALIALAALLPNRIPLC